MKRISRRAKATVGVALAASLLAACGGGGSSDNEPSADGNSGASGGGAEATLRYAFFAPITSFPGVQMEEWGQRLSEATDGRVTVDMFAGGTLLGSGDIFDGVSSGVVDVGMDSPAYDVGRFPLSSVMTLPLGFCNSQVASRTMLDLLDEYEPAEFEGMKIITAFTTEPAYIQSKQPVASRADLAGMELRTSGALTAALQTLGAAPVGMPLPEVAQALQTNVITGYASSREVLQDFGLAEQVGYVTDYAFGVSNTFVAVMDQEAFDALPEDAQAAIEEMRTEMSTFASEYHDEENVGSALEFAAENGVETITLAADEKAAFDAALQPLVDRWSQDVAGGAFDPQEVLATMNELKEQYSSEAGC